MAKYTLGLFVLFVFCTRVHSEELSCGSHLLKNGLSDKIYSEIDSLNSGSINDKSIHQVPVKIDKYTTQFKRTNGLRCLASVEVGIDDNVSKNLGSDDLHYYKEAAMLAGQYFPDYYHTVLAEGLITQKIYYDIEYKNDKDFNVDIFEPNMVSATIFGVAWFKVNSDDITKKIKEGKYRYVSNEYKTADKELNAVWNGFSVAIRKQLMHDAKLWVSDKNKICGKVEGLEKSEVFLSEKISIYECQTKMTLQRIDVLSSD